MAQGFTGPIIDAAVNYASVSSAGFSTQVAYTDWHVTLLTTSGGLASSGTIVMSSTPFDGQIVNIRTGGGVTTVTITSCSGAAVVGTPTTLAAGAITEGIFRAASTTWYF